MQLQHLKEDNYDLLGSLNRIIDEYNKYHCCYCPNPNSWEINARECRGGDFAILNLKLSIVFFFSNKIIFFV